MDNLEKDAAAAIAAGMSYGNWKAMHPHTREDIEPEEPEEPEKLQEKPQEKVAGYQRFCAHCGKEFFTLKNTNRKYCSDECAREVNNRQSREAYKRKKRSALWV